MPNTPIGLAALLRQHQDATGDSYADIARASGLSKAKIGQIATTTSPHMPRSETLQKLARGLRLPFHVVQQAAMVSAGISPATHSADQRIELLVSRLHDLPADDLDTVELFVQALHGRARP